MSFPVHFFPEPVVSFVGEGASALSSDPGYIAVPMLSVLASAIGNTRRIRLKRSWSEPAVIWTASVGDSGTMKSPAQELATRPAWRRQRALLKDYAVLRATHDAELQAWKDTSRKIRGEK